MGLPDVPKTGPFILSKTGPIFLADLEEGSDLRQAQSDSQLAGLQFAAQNPGGPPQPQEGDENTEDEEDQSTGKSQKNGSQSSKSGQKGKNTDKADDNGKDAKSNLTRAADSGEQEDNQLIEDDYRKWRMCALSDIKRGRSIRYFSSVIIPEEVHTHITRELERATSPDEVRAIFRVAQEGQLV
jgi:hypothetical protein